MNSAMGLRDSFRRRFDVPLESHQVEEDYSTAVRISNESHLPRSQSALTLSAMPGVDRRVSLSVPPLYPLEEVPSYEDSQLQHSSGVQRAPAMPVARHSYVAPPAMTLEPLLSLLLQNLVANVPPSPRRISQTEQHIQTERAQRIKQLGLKFLNARQHTALALCRDISLSTPLWGLFQLWKQVFFGHEGSLEAILNTSLTLARVLEHFLTGVWCIVSAFLTYAVIDGLLVRWIVTYSTSAAIVRVLLMLIMLIALELYLVSTFLAQGYTYGLHIWILISCALTLLYTVQNFITSNIDVKGKKRRRFFDFYKIVVFAVVPVGMALFITMIVLLRSLLILRIDIEDVRGHWHNNI